VPIKDYIRSKFIRLERGKVYTTGDISFVEGYSLNLSEGVRGIIQDDRRLKVEILGFNRRSVSCRIYLSTGIAQLKLIESKGFRKSKIKRMIAQGVLK
jgi:hypothetical protein